MSIIRHRIDSYTVKLYADDLDGRVTRWATREIHLFCEGKHVASAYFSREGRDPPDAALSDGKIIFNAPFHQYEAVLDLLRHEKPVFVAWYPHHDPAEPGDGNAVIFSGPVCP